MTIPFIEENDQTLARKQHLAELQQLVGNAYPNKFDRSNITGGEDTISNLLSFEPIAVVVKEIKEHIATLAEGEKPQPELKESLNAKLKELGNVRISGRLTTTPRTMGKAAFVHLSDGVNRLQIYVRRDDVQGIYNGIETRALSAAEIEKSQTASDKENPKSEIRNPKFINGWDLFKLLDGGDFIGVEGYLFLTNTGELSVHVETLQFLAKALLPMPDKMHGISDPELQRRYRYADLIADSLKIEHDAMTTREVFERRAKLISGMRNYLDAHGYIEVETPMLTPKATGAAAKPFKTHHNALDIDLYARIAPELYLKRLVVGGFEKVYELNRNFRNEGIDSTHNPEFTMLEFYCAYMDVNGMMDFAEKMIKESVQEATDRSLQIKYINHSFYMENPESEEVIVDFSKFERLTMKEAIVREIPNSIKELIGENVEIWLEQKSNAKVLLDFWWWAEHHLEGETHGTNSLTGEYEQMFPDEEIGELFKNKWHEMDEDFSSDDDKENLKGKNIVALFEDFVEQNLGRTKVENEIVVYPTFIIDYPKSISPLSKASPENPQIAERFELFINGMECANGFSELNDPVEQYERFLDQANAREGGDEEAMVLDEDYIRALSYGMPPAAGIGIGIDRLVMLLTNRHSIRDVILFPHLRPERSAIETEEN